MNPQDVASLRESVGKHAKIVNKGRQDKSPCCVSWADETQAVSREQTRQGSILCLTNTSTQGIQKTGPCGQITWTKDR